MKIMFNLTFDALLTIQYPDLTSIYFSVDLLCSMLVMLPLGKWDLIIDLNIIPALVVVSPSLLNSSVGFLVWLYYDHCQTLGWREITLTFLNRAHLIPAEILIRRRVLLTHYYSCYSKWKLSNLSVGIFRFRNNII